MLFGREKSLAYTDSTHQTPQPVVSIKNLNHYYGKGSLRKQILFDVSLEIQPGEIVLMTGPSGSGKTTLLTLMGGLRSPQEGSLQILGQELAGASKNKLVEVRRNIGYIFQAHNLLKCLTACQNVQMSLELHPEFSPKEAAANSAAMLEAVGLGQRVNYYPDNLSGGQKQRVAIARALVSHPKVVLADEPTAALDSKSGRDVVELMQRLAKEQGCTILMVTHDNRILDIADRIVHMEDGYLTKDEMNGAA
jgi:putative ABC transport system ATP-binding protein